jgi:hypothetical protein
MKEILVPQRKALDNSLLSELSSQALRGKNLISCATKREFYASSSPHRGVRNCPM